MIRPPIDTTGAPSGAPSSLAERVEHEAMAFEAQADEIGNFLAAYMRELAQMLRWTGATNPSDHIDRMEVWEKEIRDQWYDQGHADGLRQGMEIGRSEVLNMLKSISFQRN